MSVSGYVVDEDGFAIGGATVSLLRSITLSVPISSSALHREIFQSHSHQTSTDTRGVFSFSGVTAEDSLLLAAFAPGYATSGRFTFSAAPSACLEMAPSAGRRRERPDPTSRTAIEKRGRRSGALMFTAVLLDFASAGRRLFVFRRVEARH